MHANNFADGTLTVFRSGTMCHQEPWTARRVTNEPTISLDFSASTVAEGSSIQLTADAAFPWATNREITLQSSGSAQLGSDFTLTPGQLTIPAGSQNASLTVDALNDGIIDEGESIVLGVASVSSDETVSGPSAATVSDAGDGVLVVCIPQDASPPCSPPLRSGETLTLPDTAC